MPLTFNIHKDPRFQEGIEFAEKKNDDRETGIIIQALQYGFDKLFRSHIKAYIQAKLDANLSISTIAKKLRISESRLKGFIRKDT